MQNCDSADNNGGVCGKLTPLAPKTATAASGPIIYGEGNDNRLPAIAPSKAAAAYKAVIPFSPIA